MIEAAAHVSLFSHFLVVSLLNLVVLICKIVIYIYLRGCFEDWFVYLKHLE